MEDRCGASPENRVYPPNGKKKGASHIRKEPNTHCVMGEN